MKTNSSQNMPIEKRQLIQEEQLTIENMKQRPRQIPCQIFCTRDEEDQESVALDLAIDPNLPHKDGLNLFESHLLAATGAINTSVGLQFMASLSKTLAQGKVKGKELANQLNSLAQAMQALAPQDEYEGQLVAQLVVLHEHAMDWLGRAIRTERVDFANVYLNGASKLLTRHHETLEALLKYRRRGEQRVHVEHVHVHDGGQAIVGNVMTGGGMNQKNAEGPHAKV